MPTYSRFMECIHVEGRLGLLEVKRRQSSAVKRIVARCVDSCEDLDLGDCGLTQLPEDIFLLLRPRKLIRCQRKFACLQISELVFQPKSYPW